MRNPALVALALIICSTFAASSAMADEKDEAAIREMLAGYVEAYNQGDAAGVGKLWQDEGVYVDRAAGERVRGRDAIVASLQETLSTAAKLRLQVALNEIRFVTPEVAQLDAVATVSGADIEPIVTHVTAIAAKDAKAKDGGTWLLSSVEEIPPTVPESAREALAPLSWLVGKWADEGESADAINRSSFRWSANESFLIRSFMGKNNADEEAEGTQVIGWDPIAKQVRSWTFFSDGSFGEAVWSRTGNDWSIKSVQTLTDGRTAMGTFVIERVDGDTMRVRLVGHEVDGEPLPSKPAVTVTRQKEEVAAEKPAAPPAKTAPSAAKANSK